MPWHPELDRRHSDSVNVTKFAQTSADNDDLDNSTRSANQQKHTYQNTNLNSGTILLYDYVKLCTTYSYSNLTGKKFF